MTIGAKVRFLKVMYSLKCLKMAQERHTSHFTILVKTQNLTTGALGVSGEHFLG